MKKLIIVAAALVLGTAFAKEAQVSFDTGAIALLTREQDASHRTGGSAVELSQYLQRIKSAGAAFISETKDVPQVAGAYVVVVKPGKRARIWVHLIGDEPHQEFVDALTTALQAVEPLDVVEGPV